MEYLVLGGFAVIIYLLCKFATGGRKTPRYEYKTDASGNEYVHDHHDFSVRDLTAEQGLTFSNKPNYPLRSVGVLPGPVETKPAAGRAYMTPEGIKRTDDTPSIVPAAAVLLAMDASIGGSDDSFSGGSDNFSAGGSND